MDFIEIGQQFNNAGVGNKWHFEWLKEKDQNEVSFSEWCKKINEVGHCSCFVCPKKINYGNNGKKALKKHADDKVHQRNFCELQRTSLFPGSKQLVELCHTLAKDRLALSKLKMERTAATYITGHGVAKTMREELVAKLNKNYFSINVDEATNNNGDKIINVLVRVYDDEKKKNHNCSSRFKKRKHIHCKPHIFVFERIAG
ncbi:hypothetical protein AVEN_37202-1 [Araneus ventricosus]|uniref:DUF4371 domain-containing protein n=1 Tax=Araneus ventricosus TaxID=182803 RepID=A0A4Y2TXJ0_ARAVE|nr:hypothetical protein AVEN_261116-1 [Araneus ventricosus]GBO05072.1 hypothetical protein AVEN_37202-1 [Araneus ventricosus]